MSKFTTFFKFFSVAIVICICSLTAKAQEDSTFTNSTWLDFGLGTSSSDFFFYGHMDLNVEVKPSLLLTLAYEAPLEFNISGRSDIVQRQVQGLSLYVGKIHKAKSTIVSASVGLSYMSIHESNEDFNNRIDNRFKGIGFVGKIKLILSPGPVGIGISPYLNINSNYNLAGITIDIGIGNINQRNR